ncbi:hypothetical protein QR680_012628 [Steinernema hermaphroditum]|uniref:Major facilitator superfamily (MFS) profile domain-containing protein n=1 Tax=Steinernema hermaphroditum TaxID=289476 RepID=A0AA39I2L1_9BILA|nr:hypothetical protein QR680_012628 [Steinernema hermaphroditum]
MRSKSATSYSSYSDLTSSSIGRSESLTPRLLFAVASVAVGSSFQLGFHIGCINAPSKVISKWINESHVHNFGREPSALVNDALWSVTVSLFAVGGILGALISGWLADSVGRKKTLLALNGVVGVATAAMVTAKYVRFYPLLMLGRLLIGIHAGVVAAVVPLYIVELSPRSRRGALASVHQLMITVAILVSQVFGLPQLFGSESRWPFIFVVPMIPALFQLVTLPFCPESPKFKVLVEKKDDAAEKDLRLLRGEDDVLGEIDAILAEASAEKVGVCALFQGFYRWPTLLAATLMAAQQLSGINAVVFYSTRIFEETLGEANAIYATLAVGGVNVVLTTVSIFLIDRFGRRPPLLFGFAGMALSSFGMLGSSLATTYGQAHWCIYLGVGSIVVFVICFAIGPGSIPFFYVTELFGTKQRASASAVVALTNWVFAFVVGVGFLPLQNLFHGYVFFIFAYICTFGFVLGFVYLPETKNRSLKDVEQDMERRKPC